MRALFGPFLVLAFGGVMIVSCSSITTLTAGGSRIRVLEPSSVNRCESLGDVTKQNTNSWQERPVAEEDARNKVLNSAAAMGGTHIISRGYISHLPKTCEDCVQLSADVYRCDGAVADKAVAEVFAPPPPPEPAAPQPQDSEWNHDGHDEACKGLAGGKLEGEACTYDTECMICHDGSACGTVVNRSTFVNRGASCNLPDKAECEQATPRCCQGVCVLAPN